MRARVVQSFVAEQADDLPLAVGDIVAVTDRAADGWWTGSIDGQSGLFPGNHVELIEIEDIATPSCGPPAALRFAYEGASSHEAAVHWKASAKGANWLSPPRTRNLLGACGSVRTDEMADFLR